MRSWWNALRKHGGALLVVGCLVAVNLSPRAGYANTGNGGGPVADSQLAVMLLSFFGFAPLFANDELSFQFGVGPSATASFATEAFRHLDGVPDEVRFRNWTISPSLMGNGSWAHYNVTFDLHVPKSVDIGDGLEAKQSFGFRLMFHSGLNLLSFADLVKYSLSVGLMIDVGIGPFHELTHDDGSSASYGHVGLVRIAPAAGFSIIERWFSLSGMAGYVPDFIPFDFVEAATGDASGRYAEAQPDNPEFEEEAPEALTRIDTKYAVLFSVGGSFHFYRPSEPFLTVGARWTWRKAVYEAKESGFGLTDRFTEIDSRILFTLGIGAPADYDWSGTQQD